MTTTTTTTTTSTSTSSSTSTAGPDLVALKGVQHQVQGEQLRVIGKKRYDLQTAIAKLKEHDFGIPLQFNNFRD